MPMIQPELMNELSNIHQALPIDSSDFTCIYGSSIYHPVKISSDIDLFIASDSTTLHTAAALDQLTHTVSNLHLRYGRHIDEEVPFANKLIYTHNDLDDATDLNCFVTDDASGEVAVPPVVKTSEFLNGRNIKLRLALNALTTPHIVIAEDPHIYQRHRLAAEVGIVMTGISQQEGDTFGPEDIYISLTIDRHGNSGEMHLGYKTEYAAVKEHLDNVIERTLGRLSASGILKGAGGVYEKPSRFPVASIVRRYKQTSV